jgi:hypothetical protein
VKPRLIYSMSVSVDGFIADREGAFGWSVQSDELFRFHLDQVRGLGSCLLGRRLYEKMLVWETDPALRDNGDTDAFADVWARSRRSSSAARSTASRATPDSPSRRSPKRSPRHSTRPTRTSRSAAPASPRQRSSCHRRGEVGEREVLIGPAHCATSPSYDLARAAGSRTRSLTRQK